MSYLQSIELSQLLYEEPSNCSAVSCIGTHLSCLMFYGDLYFAPDCASSIMHGVASAMGHTRMLRMDLVCTVIPQLTVDESDPVLFHHLVE
jgi:hypothetical protein